MTGATIYALSSARGKAGVSVVRVSGPQAFASLDALARPGLSAHPRHAAYASLKDAGGGTIDRALVLSFAGPSSFTGEDVVEYHLHGSPAVVAALLQSLSRQPGHRPAEPGEFTRRAFENGKLDLTEAEAVADLIDAETEAQRRQALDQMGGALSSLYEGWRERLIRAMAYAEAVIDFPDEDVPDDEIQTVLPALIALTSEIDAHLNDGRRGERLRSGIHVAVIGAPNAGKSSLVNALARREIAIVSPLAGTTRDIVEAHLDLGGYPVVLADTAGLRETDGGGHGDIEAEGIRRALVRAGEADVTLALFDGTAPADTRTLALLDKKTIVAATKSDLPDFKTDPALTGFTPVPVSSSRGDGLHGLIAALVSRIESIYAPSADQPSLTRARHREALERCQGHLKAATGLASPELMAEELRLGARALGSITGRVDVEDLLDVIFRDFCIGK